jgi:hypothetical protein
MSTFDLVLLALASLAIAAFGILWFFADGMDPTGQKSGFGGCVTTIVGLAACGTLIWLAVR